eukprot:scaffold179377_cov30-Tisochrysis_lutea.AAC.3
MLTAAFPQERSVYAAAVPLSTAPATSSSRTGASAVISSARATGSASSGAGATTLGRGSRGWSTRRRRTAATCMHTLTA